MNTEKIAPNSTAYIYDDVEDYLTCVFLIEKKSAFYLIDTFCGPDSMMPVLNAVKSSAGKKEVIVINTHFHWDHVWGNCSFKKNKIISHERCRELMGEFWEAQINENKEYISGKVEKYLPNVTFKEKINFHDDGIELFHSPGHTADSISVFDHDEKILYVGDNLEKPVVYVEDENIPAYINTLGNYLSYHPGKIIANHTLELGEEDVYGTIKYLKGLAGGEKMHFASEYAMKVHNQNIKAISKA